MVSNINYTSIDETYPVAGQDNDSQGFRDNFGYIKNGLSTAASEISDLQSSTAKTNAATDFNFQEVSRAAFVNCGEVIYNPQTPIASSSDPLATISYTNGSLQIFQITDSITFTLSGFPTNPANQANNTSVVSKLRVQISSDDDHDITFRTNSGTILKSLGTNITSATYSSGGAINTSSLVLSGATGISMDQLIVGTGVAKETYVTGVCFVKSSKTNPTLTADASMIINGTTITVPAAPNNTINGLLNTIYGLAADNTDATLRVTSIISDNHVTADITSGVLAFYCDDTITTLQIRAPLSGLSLVASSDSQIGINTGDYTKPSTATIRVSQALTAQAAGKYHFYTGNVKNTISINNVGIYVFDFWTYNGGSTVYMDYVGNYEII